jgi:hypothetical protein
MEEVKQLYIKLAGGGSFENWLDKTSPMFSMRTPRQMIDIGKADEVIKILSKLTK